MPIKKSGRYVSKKKKINLELSLFALPAAGRTAIKITTFVERAEIGIIKPTEFPPCRKLQGVFTEISECMHVVLNIKRKNILIFDIGAWVCVWVHERVGVSRASQ